MDKVALRGIGQGQWLSLKPPGKYRELEERQDADPDWYLQGKHCQKHCQIAKWQLDTLGLWKKAWSGSSPPAITAATTSSNRSLRLSLVAEGICVPPFPQAHRYIRVLWALLFKQDIFFWRLCKLCPILFSQTTSEVLSAQTRAVSLWRDGRKAQAPWLSGEEIYNDFKWKNSLSTTTIRKSRKIYQPQYFIYNAEKHRAAELT